MCALIWVTLRTKGQREMELDEALAHAIYGQAILFVGSGFSASARNANGQALPTRNQLATLLGQEL